jgi:hypothetical protein
MEIDAKCQILDVSEIDAGCQILDVRLGPGLGLASSI